ncbi:hypothetical protein [Streptomyces antarcticus]|uniref:hypothetical protein n=1 Tax=Streptomyces antarcticus TaxID=2996458 RepID=UPI00226E4648|nr:MULTISPECIES: hypothetical protein [unclassified Streptomyces]MCY0942347.1 hypothetical protein [Streptomyces sp. H34-AA3]MCZ4080656.1 hypothetical protein [Streptomyces sp. H34-S5]
MIKLRCDTALDNLRNRHGDLANGTAAEAAKAARNRELAGLFLNLRPHLHTLITNARAGIDAMPRAPHHARWHLLITDLAHAADQAGRILDEEHPDGQDTAARDERLWPYLKTWGEHHVLLRDLALQPAHPPQSEARLWAEEETWWTDRARTARSHDLLQPIESRYEATGRQLTVVLIPRPDDHDEEVVLVLAGDIDSPEMRVIGRYDTDDQAIRDLPPAVPPGVLYPNGAPPEPGPTPGLPLAQLTRDVIDAQHSGSVADAIFYVTERPPHAPAGHIAQLSDFLDTCATWATALDTRAGQEIAVRLRMLSAQTSHLLQDLAAVGGQLAEAVAVLPPHRTPAPRHLPAPRPPTVGTTPVLPAPSGSAAPARRR